MGSQATPPPLPSGYSLDTSGPPPLPPGYAPDTNKTSWMDDVGHAIGNFWDKVNPAANLKGAADLANNAVRHPIDTFNSISANNDAPRIAAEEAFKKGDYAQGVRHVLNYFANAIPGLGTELDKAGDKGQSGDIPGMVGDTAGIATNLFAPSVASKLKIPVTKAIKATLNPVQENAIAVARGADLPVDAAMATQDPFVKGAKAILEKQPTTSGMLNTARTQSEAALADRLSSSAADVAPAGARTRLTAGTNVQTGVLDKLTQLKNTQREHYDNLAEIANRPENVKRVQTGTREIPGENPDASLTPSGQTATEPIMEDIAGPTDYSKVKKTLGPFLEKLEKQIAGLPEAQKQASPALNNLRQILQRGDVVPLDTAISDLSAIQDISRTDLPQIRNQSQGIAAVVTKPLRAALDEAADNLGPQAKQALASGRDITRQKYALAEVYRKQLRANPVQVVQRLTANEDAGLSLLKTVKDAAPDTVPDIARSTLERLINNATKKGGYKNVDSTLGMWNDIGPETKNILFGPDKTKELDGLFNYGKMLGENPNPSGTAPVGAILATAAATASHPLMGLTALFGARKLANVMLRPDAAEMLAKGMSINVGPGAGKAAAANRLLHGVGENVYEMPRAASNQKDEDPKEVATRQ